MPEPFSEEWVAALRAAGASLPPRPGATATVSVVVTGGPGGHKAEQGWQFSVVDGVVASASVGAAPEGSADLAVLAPWDDAVAVFCRGDGLDEWFMRGSTKVAGSTARLMDLLPVLRSPEWRAACEGLAAA